MSSIREREADQSHQLVGRTRAERLLDGIYQRQKKYIYERRKREAAAKGRRIELLGEKRLRLQQLVPQTPASTTAAALEKTEDPQKLQQKQKQQPTKKKSLEEAVAVLQRHLWKRSKFEKAVVLLQQLWETHLAPETKRCLLAGLLTAASTDSCISSPEGRVEIATFYRRAVEPVLQRERMRRQQQQLLEQKQRMKITQMREATLSAHLQRAVRRERAEAAAAAERERISKPTAAAAVQTPRYSDAGTRATVDAVAAAAAAVFDREEQRKQQKERAREASSVFKTSSREEDAAAAAEHRAARNALLVQRPPQQAPTKDSTSAEAVGQDGASTTAAVQLEDAEKELLEVLQLRCKTHLLLFTDDAFQFHQQMAELRRVFDAMLRAAEEGQQDEDEENDYMAATAAAAPSTDHLSTNETRHPSELPGQKLQQEQRFEDEEEREKSTPSSRDFTSGRQAATVQGYVAAPAEDATTAEHAAPAKAHAATEGTGWKEEDAAVREEAATSDSTGPAAAPQDAAAAAGNTDEAEVKREKREREGTADDEEPLKMQEDTLEERWPLPLKQGELNSLLKCFFMDCLASVFSYRNISWSRASIEQLFQHVYLNRYIFNDSDRGQIGLWQAQLKMPTNKPTANVEVLSIGESAMPVHDGREERIMTTHGSIIWSAKQMGC